MKLAYLGAAITHSTPFEQDRKSASPEWFDQEIAT